MNTVELFSSCKGILRKKTKKHGENMFTLFWITLRCFWGRGGKGGSNEDSTSFVYLDKLLIWVIITIESKFAKWATHFD